MKGFSWKGLLLFGECKGITQKGKRCRAVEVWGNGYCKHHGGAGTSPFEIRKQALIQKIERQSARHRKRRAKYQRLAAKAAAKASSSGL